MSVEKAYDEIKLGDSAAWSRTITEADIQNFAGVSGDFNSIHIDEQYAKTTRFKGRIAHGFLTASFISAIIGNELPGRSGVYLKQDLCFLAPVRIGDTIVCKVKVMEKIDAKKRIRLRTVCSNEKGEDVVDGEALLMLLK